MVTDPISKAVLQFWPSPNAPGTTINCIANVAAATFDNTGRIKIDHNFSDRDRLSGLWAEFEGAAVTAGAIPQLGGTSNAPISRSGVITETHTFTPTLLNDFDSASRGTRLSSPCRTPASTLPKSSSDPIESHSPG